ncbi:hypothetical protein [Pseudomonas sp. CHM02]|uniref:hypothetical protein n=1 Tax=Pseudomonas sp. CHM02 TaxID=1463662 RepID=UPI0012DF0895|nr:hypothetical protein [Pseudomonas sp. CHM02]
MSVISETSRPCLMAAALHDADVPAVQVDRCVRFDSEEACYSQHGGDWRVRLARQP